MRVEDRRRWFTLPVQLLWVRQVFRYIEPSNIHDTYYKSELHAPQTAAPLSPRSVPRTAVQTHAQSLPQEPVVISRHDIPSSECWYLVWKGKMPGVYQGWSVNLPDIPDMLTDHQTPSRTAASEAKGHPDGRAYWQLSEAAARALWKIYLKAGQIIYL